MDKDDIMEQIAEAIGEVAQTAVPAVEAVVSVEAISSAVPTIAEVIPSPAVNQEAIDKLTDRVLDLREAEKPPVPSAASQQSVGPESTMPPDQHAEVKPTQIPDQAINEAVQIAEGSGELKEILDAIKSNPTYQRILGERVLQTKEAGEDVDVVKLQKEALTKYIQETTGEVTQQTQNQEGVSLTAEQQANLTKEIQKAFKNDPSNMTSFTKEASVLAKSQSDETRLKRDQNATPDQIAKAAGLTAELKNKYDIKLEEMMKRISVPNEDPKNHPLVILLREAPNNPDLLRLMQKEAKKTLLGIILQLVAMLAYSVVNETGKTIIPPLGQQG